MSNNSTWEAGAITAGLLLAMACCGGAIFWCLKNCAGSRQGATRQAQDDRGSYAAIGSPSGAIGHPGLTHRSPPGGNSNQTPRDTFRAWIIDSNTPTPPGNQRSTNEL